MAQRDPQSGTPAWSDASEEPPLEPDPLLDLTCPSCGANLHADDLFATFRVCSRCHRHFTLTARERLALLVDEGSFAETNATLASVDPLVFHDRLPFPDRLAEARERTGVYDAVVTGVATIGGYGAVLIALDGAYVGHSIGVVAGEKITLAMELAASRRLPLVALCAGGGARTQEGLLSLVQLAKTTAAATRLHRAGVPFVCVLGHPTVGAVYAGPANQADLIFAEPGAQIGFGAAREPAEAPAAPGTSTAEVLLANGMIDSVVDRVRLPSLLATLLGLFAARGSLRPAPANPSPAATANPPAWEAVSLARHPDRPTALDFIQRLMPEFVELHGDRIGADDPAVVCGLGRFEGVTIAVVAQERGRGVDHERRRGGRMRPAGYRKASRLMRLAGHLELPLVTLIDTPGAATGAEAEAQGIGLALSQAFGLMSMLPVPIVTVTIGEGGSAGALALGIGDRILMLEHAVYSVVGPESPGALLYRAADRAADATASLKLTARECQRLGVVDAIVPEPTPAAHADPDGAALHLRAALSQALAEVSGSGPRRLIDERARKVRFMGQTTPEGRDATRRELTELQELQRSLSRSLGDLRVRWENRKETLPRLSLNVNLANLPRPDLSHWPRPDLSHLRYPDLASRVAAMRASMAHGPALKGERAPTESAPPPAPETGEEEQSE